MSKSQSLKNSSVQIYKAYNVSPWEWPWRQSVFQRKMLATWVFVLTTKEFRLTHKECVLQQVPFPVRPQWRRVGSLDKTKYSLQWRPMPKGWKQVIKQWEFLESHHITPIASGQLKQKQDKNNNYQYHTCQVLSFKGWSHSWQAIDISLTTHQGDKWLAKVWFPRSQTTSKCCHRKVP